MKIVVSPAFAASVIWPALVFALCSSSNAQQTVKTPRIGFVSATGDPNHPGPHVEAFRQGLRDLGYIDGKTILLESRYLEGSSERVPSLVADLVNLKVDVLVLGPQPAIRAAKQATK